MNDFKDVLTCAVLFRCKNQFLICHVTGSKSATPWSLPKGLNEKDEELNVSAARELFEETGIQVKSSDLIYKGTFPYLKGKNLALFEYISSKFIPINELKCSSTFYNEKFNKNLPEVNGYMYTTLEDCQKYINIPTYNILNTLFKKGMIFKDV